MGELAKNASSCTTQFSKDGQKFSIDNRYVQTGYNVTEYSLQQ